MFGHIAGIPLSVPEELKDDNYEIKNAPIIGKWYVLSPSRVTSSKRRLLKSLGFEIIDLKEKFDMKTPTKPMMLQLIASTLTGVVHDKVPSEFSGDHS